MTDDLYTICKDSLKNKIAIMKIEGDVPPFLNYKITRYEGCDIDKVYKVEMTTGDENLVNSDNINEIRNLMCSRKCKIIIDDDHKCFYIIVEKHEKGLFDQFDPLLKYNFYKIYSIFLLSIVDDDDSDSCYLFGKSEKCLNLLYIYFSFFTLDSFIKKEKDEMPFEQILLSKTKSIKNSNNLNKTKSNNIDKYKDIICLAYYCPDKNAIYYCDKLIKSCYFNKIINKEKPIANKDYFSLQDFRNLILFHELGHLVFNNNLYRSVYTTSEEEERRANFILSITTLGMYDDVIKKFSEIQPPIYKNPLLLIDRMKSSFKEKFEEIVER